MSNFVYEYIRTFVRVHIFYMNIFGHSSVSNLLYEYIRKFIRVNFLIQIQSNIHLCLNFHKCHTLV